MNLIDWFLTFWIVVGVSTSSRRWVTGLWTTAAMLAAFLLLSLIPISSTGGRLNYEGFRGVLFVGGVTALIHGFIHRTRAKSDGGGPDLG